MKIATKLKIAALIPALISLVIGFALFFSVKTVQDAQRKDRAAQRIISGMNELSSLIGEYVIYHEDRPLQQFLLEHDSIERFTAAIRFDQGEQQQLLENIRRDMELMKGIFQKLVSNRRHHGSAEDDAFIKEVENRLAGRLLVWARGVVSHASDLERLIAGQLVVTQRKISSLVFALIVTTALFLTFLLLGMTRSITASLTRLREGTESIGAGDLDHRVATSDGDEIGDLSRAFDRMTGRLQAVTVSRDTLRQEVEERTKAEAALEESLAKLRIIADFTYDWEHWRSPDNRFLYVSPSCERITGYSREEFIETPELYSRIVHPDDRSRVVEHLIGRESHRELCEMEFRIIRRDGRERWIAHACLAVMDDEGRMLGRRACDRDITGRKRVEEELEKSRKDLERRVKERTMELEEKNKELEDFTFFASHDLQEPLRKIRTFGDLLLLKTGSSLNEQSLDHISRMQRAAERMQTLLRSLLDYSLVAGKEQVFKRVDLAESLEESLSNLEVLVREKGAHVEARDLPVVEADPEQMIQLFQNLIGNALKFQRAEEPPHVKVYSRTYEEAGRGKAHQIYVEDNGIGFDAARYLHRIFEPFRRLHGREEFEGVGIGLGICRRIVERHGGGLTAESTPGEGSRFIITLPEKRRAKKDP